MQIPSPIPVRLDLVNCFKTQKSAFWAGPIGDSDISIKRPPSGRHSLCLFFQRLKKKDLEKQKSESQWEKQVHKLHLDFQLNVK
jgi:hypothetical protein